MNRETRSLEFYVLALFFIVFVLFLYGPLSAILILSFVSMSTSSMTDLKILATGLGAGILVDAVIVRCLLVPAMVALFGTANWWLPRWLDQRLPRISIEPPECRAAHERLAAATDAAVADVLADGEREVRDITG